MNGVHPIVQTMPLRDLTYALQVASVGPKGKPRRVVASLTQVRIWHEDVAKIARMCGNAPATPGDVLYVMGIPVATGPDGPPELIWSEVVEPRVKVTA